MRVSWIPEAEEELNLAAEWYERQVPSLGARFVNEVLYLVDHDLTFAPLSHPRVRGAAGKRGVRRALVDNFPYALIYASDDPEELVVIAVFHTSRARVTWRRRLT